MINVHQNKDLNPRYITAIPELNVATKRAEQDPVNIPVQTSHGHSTQAIASNVFVQPSLTKQSMDTQELLAMHIFAKKPTIVMQPGFTTHTNVSKQGLVPSSIIATTRAVAMPTNIHMSTGVNRQLNVTQPSISVQSSSLPATAASVIPKDIRQLLAPQVNMSLQQSTIPIVSGLPQQDLPQGTLVVRPEIHPGSTVAMPHANGTVYVHPSNPHLVMHPTATTSVHNGPPYSSVQTSSCAPRSAVVLQTPIKQEPNLISSAASVLPNLGIQSGGLGGGSQIAISENVMMLPMPVNDINNRSTSVIVTHSTAKTDTTSTTSSNVTRTFTTQLQQPHPSGVPRNQMVYIPEPNQATMQVNTGE